MSESQIIEVAGLFLAGMLAGEEFTVFYGIRGPLASLEQYSQILMRQALIHRLKFLVPSIAMLTIAFAVIGLISSGQFSGIIFVLRIVSLLGLIAWAAITFPGTAPVNQAIAEWDPKMPPENWRGMIKKWERFASVRPWATMMSFATLTIAAVL